MEAMSLEYTYLLTSQLDSQRIYYEECIENAASNLSALTTQAKSLIKEVQNLRRDNKTCADNNADMARSIAEIRASIEELHKQLSSHKQEYERLSAKLTKEKEVHKDAHVSMHITHTHLIRQQTPCYRKMQHCSKARIRNKS